MGAAMTARLIENGHELTVWNRTRTRAEPLAAIGARVSGSAAALSSASEIIISVLTDANALGAAYHGADGLLSGAVTGKLFVDMSTIRPGEARALAEKVRASGAAFVESPVSGSVGPAREGKLFALVGGEPADVARLRPILDGMCRRIEHCGPVGSAASMKLAINLPLLVYYQALGEALALAKPIGLAPERVIDMLSDTSGTPAMMKNRGPSIAKQLAGTDVPPTVDVATICKDLRTILDELQSRGSDSPLARKALECYGLTIEAGLADADCTRLPVTWHERAPGKRD